MGGFKRERRLKALRAALKEESGKGVLETRSPTVERQGER
jgi:hypothetical protein